MRSTSWLLFKTAANWAMKKTIGLSTELAAFIKLSNSGKRLMPSGRRIANGVIENYMYANKNLSAYLQLASQQFFPITIILVFIETIQVINSQ